MKDFADTGRMLGDHDIGENGAVIPIVIEDHGGYVVTADVPCRLCEEGDIVPHNPSPKCESGSRPHCTCDRCL